MPLSQPERQALQSQLDSLQLLQQNSLFSDFIEHVKSSLAETTLTLLDVEPSSIGEFITRERMLGAAKELRQISTYFSTLEEDLKTQLTQQ
jgi:hypothetical protein